DLFEDFVTTLFDLGQTFAGLIDDHPHFELSVLPQTNILCFRWNPTNLPSKTLNQLNKNIRQELLENKRFYIVQTQLKGQTFLRTTLMNPFTDVAILKTLLEEIEQTARELLAQPMPPIE
ncbi:MAG: pyridoxal-dependent decarboxylase, partial [Bacteroidota bacterium]